MTTNSTAEVNLAERERLLAWMAEKGIDLDTLGEITGDSYASLFLMLRSSPDKARPINDKFKWRFAGQFGLVEARKIFDDAPPESVSVVMA